MGAHYGASIIGRSGVINPRPERSTTRLRSLQPYVPAMV
jgi:hypothetical protein